MNNEIIRSSLSIRTWLRPGDLNQVIYFHAGIYRNEYGYSEAFENYVAMGLAEFYKQYDCEKDSVWICEHENCMVGFLVLMHRDDNFAQLRYFLLDKKCRGLGLGKEMMQLFINCLHEKGYKGAYLWTTNEQEAAARLYKSFGFKLIEQKYSQAFGKPLYEQKYVVAI